MPESDGAGEEPARARSGGRRRRAPPEIRLTLLGGFALHQGGEARRVPLGAQRLVALLAVHGGGLHRADAALLLAPHLGSESASRSLRTALSRLNASGPGVVERSGATLRLAARVSVDAREVMRIAAGLAGRLEEPPGAVDISLLTRTLLPGWSEDWVQMERHRLRDRSLLALETHARRLAERGELDAALEAVHAALRADPLRESAALVLIEIHLSQANAGAARSAYLAFRERSVRELDLEPSEELQDLVRPLVPRRAGLRGPRIRRRPRWRWVE
ncbi:MAG: SARP family transcriptional regulator [Chloroflexi bacterium]|nr:SARP family transcriptional regulator [Chloroflexota bacterium]